MGSGRVVCTQTLTLPRRSREVISERPSAQENKKTKGDNISITTTIIEKIGTP